MHWILGQLYSPLSQQSPSNKRNKSVSPTKRQKPLSFFPTSHLSLGFQLAHSLNPSTNPTTSLTTTHSLPHKIGNTHTHAFLSLFLSNPNKFPQLIHSVKQNLSRTDSSFAYLNHHLINPFSLSNPLRHLPLKPSSSYSVAPLSNPKPPLPLLHHNKKNPFLHQTYAISTNIRHQKTL